MKKKLIIISAAGLLLLAGIYAGCKHYYGQTQNVSASAQKYTCPMHPRYISDKPGNCPICGMKLVPVEAGKKAPKIKFYRNPMNPDVTSPVPAKDEMGMDYVPVYEEENPRASSAAAGNVIEISPERRQLIGIQSAPAETKELYRTVRCAGRVAYDPDLFHAIAEYQEAVQAGNKVSGSQWPDVTEQSRDLVTSAALRLKQLGLSDARIKELSVTTQTPTNLLLSQGGGTIWVYAQVYEYEMGFIKPGQTASVESSAYPGKIFKGAVRSADAILSEDTRSLKIRVEVPDPDNLLKPNMYVDVSINVSLGRKLAVPGDAVMDTGTRKIVFLDLGEGRFRPQEVRVGYSSDDYIQVVDGLKEGERVVTSANFLLDSESRLKGILQDSGNKK